MQKKWIDEREVYLAVFFCYYYYYYYYPTHILLFFCQRKLWKLPVVYCLLNLLECKKNCQFLSYFFSFTSLRLKKKQIFSFLMKNGRNGFSAKKNIHAQSLLYYIPLDKTILLLQLFTLRNLLDIKWDKKRNWFWTKQKKWRT